MKTSKKAIYKTLHALADRTETCTRLHKLKVPVLIMVGKEDEITPPDTALLMHEKIKDSVLQVIDHAGHLSNMENSREFNNHLSGFLSLIKHL